LAKAEEYTRYGRSTILSYNKYYLCGKSLMMVEIPDLLISKGIPYDIIFARSFQAFKSSNRGEI
jgi:hypothetical protein